MCTCIDTIEFIAVVVVVNFNFIKHRKMFLKNNNEKGFVDQAKKILTEKTDPDYHIARKFSTRSDTKRDVRSQKMDRGLKFRI